MRSANLHGVLVLECALVEGCGQFSDPSPDQRGGLFHHQGLSGIHDIVGGQTIVQPAGGLGVTGGGHGFSDIRSKRDNIVPDLVLDFVDAVDGEVGMLTEQTSGILRDFAGFGQRLGGRQLDLEPLTEPIVFTPDTAHFGPCIAGNHD